ncbi:MAG: ATP-binding cassette domain-containing protein [Clostridium sp.]
MNDTILEVKDLSVTFTQYDRGFSRRTIHAVEKMDLEIKSGEIVAVVGSSGSGKSLLAHAIMGILPYNSEMDGEIRFLGEPLTEKKVKRLRGHEIVLVPQSVSYLDPLMKIGDQIQNGKKDVSVKEKCLAVLKRYGLGYPEKIPISALRRHDAACPDLHGGDGEAKLVIADEPTPGLHLEAATRVMGHFREMADDGAGVLLITHDLELALPDS